MTTRDDTDLTEIRVHSESVFEGRLLKVRRDTVRLPNGLESTREYILHPGAAVVIALTDDGGVIMVQQYRYSVQRLIVEFPAGKLDEGEDPLVCARRELLEETGYTAQNWTYAGLMHLAVGYSDEAIHIFVARSLSPGKQQLDDEEFLHVDIMPVADVLDACRTGGITDAKSLSCALWLQNIHEGRWKV